MPQQADEQTIWEGHPSQLVNFGLYLVCLLTCVLIVPIFVAVWRWIVTAKTVYRLTTQRMFRTVGVFSKRTDALELYRVRDLRVTEPFWLRLFRLGNIELDTSDRTDPLFILPAIAQARALSDKIRENVEICRKTKGVRQVDFDSQADLPEMP